MKRLQRILKACSANSLNITIEKQISYKNFEFLDYYASLILHKFNSKLEL